MLVLSRARWHFAAIVCSIVLVSACTDNPTPLTGPPVGAAVLSVGATPGFRFASASHSNSTPPSGIETNAGRAVARALAMALQDPAVRQELKQALATSAIREHKLHLVSFLGGRGGNILRAAYNASGLSPQQFRDAMANLRPLEFYMPVADHQQAWAGGPNLIVALVIQKREVPVGFALDGTSLVLNRDKAPATPTLVLTQIETDFRDQIALNEAGLVLRNCPSVSSETLAAASGRCGATVTQALRPSGASSNIVSGVRLVPGAKLNLAADPTVVGLYATFLRVLDAHEYWYQGEPEVEIHVTGKRNGAAGQAIDYQCSGEHAADAMGFQPGIRDQSYVFDMNGNFWEGQEVRILNAAQLDTLQAAEPAGFNVSMWEDDDVACQVRQHNVTLFQQAVQATQSIARGINSIHVDSTNFGVLAGAIQEIAALVQGDDDYIGLLVDKDSTSYAGTNPGNTHMIFDGTTQNGRATLVLKRVSRATSMTGSADVPAYSASSWTASSSGTLGAVTYSWNLNGEPVQSGSSNSFGYQNDGHAFTVGVTATDSQGAVGTSSIVVYVRGYDVIISGMTSVAAHHMCGYSSSINEGTAPYTYQWKLDGVVLPDVGETTNPDLGEGTHTLESTVTDANGLTGNKSISIDVTTNGPQCE